MGLRVYSLSVVLVLFSAAGAAAAGVVEVSKEVEAVLESRHPKNVAELRTLEAHVRRVVEQSIPATVGIEVENSVGSGVIVNAKGLVLTAGHVIGDAGRDAIILLPDGRRLPGRTLGVNKEIDAGMVRINHPPADLPFVPIVAKTRPEISRWVVATGQPGGTYDDRSPPVRLGRILAGREGWVRTDCTLVGGDSGGPLFNMRGEVTAIHTSIGPSVNHNFHVPVAMIQEDWQRLLGKRRSILGIAGREQNNRCLVTRVFSGRPAQVAGIQAGDYILDFDNNEVHSFLDVKRLIDKKQPGQRILLRLERDGNPYEVEVVLSSADAPLAEDASTENSSDSE